MVDWDDFVGQFEAVDSRGRAPAGQRLSRPVGFKDGDIVRKGQVLFVIDPRPYQAALDQAKGQEAHAAGRARQRQDRAQARARRLLAARAISQQDLRHPHRHRAAGRGRPASRPRRRCARAALNLGFTRVTAPIAGRVSDRRVAPGNLVTADTTVLTNIVDLDPIRFAFTGSEALYLKYQRANQAGTRHLLAPDGQPGADPAAGRDRPTAGRAAWTSSTTPLDTSSGTIRGRAVVRQSRATS